MGNKASQNRRGGTQPSRRKEKELATSAPHGNDGNDGNDRNDAYSIVITSDESMTQQLRHSEKEGKLSTCDFEYLRVLGMGHFAKVFLVKSKKTGRIYAMKVLKKTQLMKMKQVEHTIAERNILQAAHHPFIVNLEGAFQTHEKLYMLLEYCPGGELFQHLKKDGGFSERRAKFYIVEVILALEHVHSRNVVYRDLKLENVLLDSTGHVKLTDFGLSKELLHSKAKTFCGTPEYLAPEMISQPERGYGKSVDWWSLGILWFEMLNGLPPFYVEGGNTPRLYELILKCPIQWPSHFSGPVRSVISQLLIRAPAKRLGGGPGDAAEVKACPYFADINWDDLAAQKIEPPVVPKLKVTREREVDVRWFDPEFTQLPAEETPPPASRPILKAIGRASPDPFQGFSYTPGHMIPMRKSSSSSTGAKGPRYSVGQSMDVVEQEEEEEERKCATEELKEESKGEPKEDAGSMPFEVTDI